MNMDIQFYNTLTRKKEKFIPVIDGKVSMYTCGPTAYNQAHIGNFRTFLFEDVLKRFLMLVGYEINHVMNITDVDDKTIKKANNENISLKELTDKYTKIFMEDLETLNILPADIFPIATEHVDDMIVMIKSLIDKDHAYITDDGSVYFSIKTFEEYGKLTNLDFDNQIQSERVAADEYSKETPQDFALWKSWKDEDGEIGWDSPWGKGRPGWHIECSAMSIKYLGDHFDIHCGGVDNIFPHHENEIAQSRCSFGSPFVNVWMHSEHLNLEDEKMSKTLGNILSVPSLVKKGYTPESIRFALISSHYRTKIAFSETKLTESKKAVHRINEVYDRLKTLQKTGTSLPNEYEDFVAALSDDLNTPKALGILFSYIKKINKKMDISSFSEKETAMSIHFIENADKIFSLLTHDGRIPEDISALVLKRDKARKSKDWQLSDKIREKINQKGWIVEDSSDGTKCYKA
ncbi:MAG: cysteine--tRNA ligase [Candidatus Marinimicrobia bacterium]|nr:cysteine--tRNA ligase [Candidatus Neomarinimicrobiota bacterium]